MLSFLISGRLTLAGTGREVGDGVAVAVADATVGTGVGLGVVGVGVLVLVEEAVAVGSVLSAVRVFIMVPYCPETQPVWESMKKTE